MIKSSPPSYGVQTLHRTVSIRAKSTLSVRPWSPWKGLLKCNPTYIHIYINSTGLDQTWSRNGDRLKQDMLDTDQLFGARLESGGNLTGAVEQPFERRAREKWRDGTAAFGVERVEPRDIRGGKNFQVEQLSLQLGNIR